MRFSFVLAVWLVPASLLCGQSAPSSMPASAPASNPADWAPWSNNSIQPPPSLPSVKLPPATTQPGDGATEAIHRACMAWFDTAIEQVDDMVPYAEAAADKILKGGELYCTGSPGFIAEMFGRAGGFSFLKEWDGRRLNNDVLLVGQLSPREEGPRDVDFAAIAVGNGGLTGGRVVHIASHQWTLVKDMLPSVRARKWGKQLCLIDTKAPEGDGWVEMAVNQMATCAMGWAFQGEMFAAATRREKMLCTYASLCEPGGEKWYKQFKDVKLMTKFQGGPIPPGQVAREYLRTCQRQIAAFLESKQGDQVRLASRRMLETMQGGGTVWTIIAGHVHVAGGRFPPKTPKLVMFGRDWEWQGHESNLKKGDMLFYMAYLDYPEKYVADALERGATAVTVSVEGGPTDERRTNIRGTWAKWDSTINVYNYPVRILPPSGVVQTPEWYSIMAELEAAQKKAAATQPAK